MPTTTEPGGLLKRLGWFVGLWVFGVVSVGAVAWVLRLALHTGH